MGRGAVSGRGAGRVQSQDRGLGDGEELAYQGGAGSFEHGGGATPADQGDSSFRPRLAGQFTSLEFGKRCRETGVRPSMGSVGDCYDNAMAESFFATLECELLDRNTFRTREKAEAAVFNFIEGWYNPRRKHSSLSYRSPVKFEKEYYQALREQLRTALTNRGRGVVRWRRPPRPPCG
jgi:transposase InsO family protein